MSVKKTNGNNPWVTRSSTKEDDHGRKAERQAARRLGGKLSPGSGNGGVKGDYTVDQFKIENKATIHESLSIKRDWLLKIKQESKEIGKVPALAIQYVDGQGTPKKNGSWVMVEESVFAQLIENQNEII